MKDRRASLVCALLLAFAAGGCGSSNGGEMSAQEKAAFGGASAGGARTPRTAAQNAQIKDFQENFKRLHPDTNQAAPSTKPGG